MWRTAFGLGIIPLCFIIFWRVYKLQESAVWAANRDGRDRKRETRLLFRHFWHRCRGLRLLLDISESSKRAVPTSEEGISYSSWGYYCLYLG